MNPWQMNNSATAPPEQVQGAYPTFYAKYGPEAMAAQQQAQMQPQQNMLSGHTWSQLRQAAPPEEHNPWSI